MHVPASRGHFSNSIGTGVEKLPELFRTGGSGETAAHADDGNGFGVGFLAVMGCFFLMEMPDGVIMPMLLVAIISIIASVSFSTIILLKPISKAVFDLVRVVETKGGSQRIARPFQHAPSWSLQFNT